MMIGAQTPPPTSWPQQALAATLAPPAPVDRWPMIGPPSLAALGLDAAHVERATRRPGGESHTDTTLTA